MNKNSILCRKISIYTYRHTFVKREFFKRVVFCNYSYFIFLKKGAITISDRDRLIEILQKRTKDPCHLNGLYEWADDIADYLIANGVIVPPCKVGGYCVLFLL